ncbi:MAG: glycosyltransferase family 2 protein [Nanoarchaeota archaeon]|nr:glycosyltransferase family 2 protein [Nanoarchaeota archaeon]
MLKELLILVGVVSLFVNLYWLMLYFTFKNHLKKDKRCKGDKLVSILVPAFNEEKSIKKCLTSLVSLDYSKKLLEIIVIDDASTDNTFSIASAFVKKYSFVKLIRSKKNTGKKGGALNLGLKKIKDESRIIVVLDADSFIHKNTLKKMLHFFDEGYDAVSMRYMPWNRKSILAKMQVFEYMYSILWRKLLSVMDSMYVTPGVFSAYSFKALKDVGFFSEDCFTEDMELALKLQKKKYRIAYSFSTTAYTTVPVKLRPYVKQRERWYRGYIDSLRRHKDIFFNRGLGSFGNVLMPLNLFSTVLVIFISSLFFITFLNTVFNFLNWAYKFYLINFDLQTYFVGVFDTSLSVIFQDFVKNFFLNLDLLSFITVFSIFFAGVMLFIVKRTTKEAQGKDLLLFPIFLVFYLPLNSVLWLYSLTLECLGIRRKW